MEGVVHLGNLVIAAERRRQGLSCREPTCVLGDRQQTQDEKNIAIRALGKYRDADCVDALVYILRTEKDVALRDSAYVSLETITGKSYARDPQQWLATDGAAPPLPVVGEAPGVIQRVIAILPK